jgi:hypothetical protein
VCVCVLFVCACVRAFALWLRRSFKFEMSPEYLSVQEMYLAMVGTFDPQNIVDLLHRHPFHVRGAPGRAVDCAVGRMMRSLMVVCVCVVLFLFSPRPAATAAAAAAAAGAACLCSM